MKYYDTSTKIQKCRQAGDDKVTRFLRWDAHKTIDDTKNMIRQWVNNYQYDSVQRGTERNFLSRLSNPQVIRGGRQRGKYNALSEICSIIGV